MRARTSVCLYVVKRAWKVDDRNDGPTLRNVDTIVEECYAYWEASNA